MHSRLHYCILIFLNSIHGMDIAVVGKDVKSTQTAIGRIHFIPPSQEELFYLRLLLHHCSGAKSYNDLKSFNGVLHESFQAVAVAKHLLDDANECLSWSKKNETTVCHNFYF